MNLIDDARTMSSDLIEFRHGLHREPEIGLHLPMTQRRVLDAIADLGLEITAGDGLSSVTAVLRGNHPGPTVLLRADMDALPVVEATDVAFRSQVDGAMHACGHDLHTTMLMGAAHVLARHRDALSGNVIFMFQPGEEGFDGAGKMLAEGILDAAGDRPIAAYAMHVFSDGDRPRASFATRPGTLMAASDDLTVTVHGRGGHGSAPHRAADPIPPTCEMVQALQTFLTRSVDAFEPAVLTVGSIHAGTRSNIIPDHAEIVATVRTFSPEVQEIIATGAARVCEGIAAASGLTVETSYRKRYPATVNDNGEAAFVGATVRDLFGAERFIEMSRPITGSEDFSRVIKEIPGAMIFLGAMPAGADPATRPENHSPYAWFDDGVIPDGAALYAELAHRQLATPVI